MEKTESDFDFADTVFARDIEGRVFQMIVFRCLEEIAGVALAHGNILDNILGRESHDKLKGIAIEQDQKSHAVNIRIEVNIRYGLSIPDKAEEIQTKVAMNVSRLTGLHVASIHVVFKNILADKIEPKYLAPVEEASELAAPSASPYNDEF